ncbi:hypothetical protein ACFY94_02670 [Streptomyces griseorubiginosus]|uniref:hypothetical protein n=1 Tax=Streptomyces griseorubiginosus TaxID=67304 RepID=UPI0036EC7FA1
MTDWIWEYDGYDPADEVLRESLCTLGNGYLAVRGALPGESGRILRLHLFHVLQTLSPHTADLDVGVPTRGLHGEAYRGHVFWDELFVLPYLNLHFPEVSRALLRYRHRRLEQACAAARATGRRGALYPWQSGSDGREETQRLHLNPRSGRWLPDHSRLQHHVGSAIAYNVWQYCEASGDAEFLHTKGAEMLLQIAASRPLRPSTTSAWDRIRGVVGPDEYHERDTRTGLNRSCFRTHSVPRWSCLVVTRLLPGLSPSDGCPAGCRRDAAASHRRRRPDRPGAGR